MAHEKVLREAVIAPSAVRYKVLADAATLAASIVGIAILPLSVPITTWYYRRYYANLRVRLTTREIKVDRGVLVREEKSIPLEKITDLAVYQGPIMRWMDLKGIRVETAGQSGGGSALVSIVGLDDTDGFRDRVLAQRDRIADRDDGVAGSTGAGSGSGVGAGEATVVSDADQSGELPDAARERDAALLELVTEIRDLLRGLESSRAEH